MLEKRQIGFNAYLWGRFKSEREIENCLETLANLGYSLIELKDIQFDPEKRLSEQLKKTRRIGSQYGIDISNIVILRDILHPEKNEDSLRDIIYCVEEISEAGINVLNLVTSGIPENMTEGKAWCILLESFERILKVAEENKVYLAVEAVVGHICHDYYTTRELIRSLPSEYLCITFDPSHYLIYRNDISWSIIQWGNKIKHVHLKDAVGKFGKWGLDFIFPILGEGAIDWISILDALDKISYKGTLSIEFESFNYYKNYLQEDPIKAARLSIEALNTLWKLYADKKMSEQEVRDKSITV
ncbi:MAG: sugar phosphate isomerase/epimerase [bacterium]|nr:sugar phosphate isomerase/epimerase [bacterium]